MGPKWLNWCSACDSLGSSGMSVGHAPPGAGSDSRSGERTYSPRRPEKTVLYQAVANSLETFLDWARGHDRCVPRFVERELRRFLECGVLAFG